jgi:hypothetical protein
VSGAALKRQHSRFVSTLADIDPRSRHAESGAQREGPEDLGELSRR